MLRAVLAIGLGWTVLWMALWAIVFMTIAIVDPDSIDPGEGRMFTFIFGPMGLFSGVVFGIPVSLGKADQRAGWRGDGGVGDGGAAAT